MMANPYATPGRSYNWQVSSTMISCGSTAKCSWVPKIFPVVPGPSECIVGQSCTISYTWQGTIPTMTVALKSVNVSDIDVLLIATDAIPAAPVLAARVLLDCSKQHRMPGDASYNRARPDIRNIRIDAAMPDTQPFAVAARDNDAEPKPKSESEPVAKPIADW
eukprot:tig00020563_g11234.t1